MCGNVLTDLNGTRISPYTTFVLFIEKITGRYFFTWLHWICGSWSLHSGSFLLLYFCKKNSAFLAIILKVGLQMNCMPVTEKLRLNEEMTLKKDIIFPILKPVISMNLVCFPKTKAPYLSIIIIMNKQQAVGRNVVL